MKLAIVVAQISRCTYSVSWLTRIQLLAFIPSSDPVAMWNVRVSAVSVNSSSLNHHGFTYVSFVVCVDLLMSWANQLHVLEPHRKWGLRLNPRKVNLNPLVTHYWPFQVDALLWLLQSICVIISLPYLSCNFYSVTFEFRVTTCLENNCLLVSSYVICLLPSISLWLFYLMVLWAGFRNLLYPFLTLICLISK